MLKFYKTCMNLEEINCYTYTRIYFNVKYKSLYLFLYKNCVHYIIYVTNIKKN